MKKPSNLEYFDHHRNIQDKVVKVIASCKTFEQMKSVKRYADLYFNKIDKERYPLGSMHGYYSGKIIGALEVKIKYRNENRII